MSAQPNALPTLRGAAQPVPASFLLTHALAPFAALMAASIVLMGLHGDFLFADWLYLLEGQRWAFKHAFVTESLIHWGGKYASWALWLFVFGACLWQRYRADARTWSRPLLGLLASTLAAVSLVALVKQFSGMDCPWDLTRYGGERGFIGLFDIRPADMPKASCFPAAHSSTGFLWVALYFYFLATRPACRWAGLGLGLGAGMVFGLSQQLRGAHFLSHDLWSLAICWFVALAVHLAMNRVPATDG